MDIENKRYYNFSCMSYVPMDDMKKYLENNHLVRHYAMIWHDKEDSVPHSHIIICLRNNCTSTALYKRLKIAFPNVNTLVEVMLDFEGIFEYLIHKNQPNKFQYDIKDIVSDDINWFLSAIDNNKLVCDSSIGIIQDLIANVPLEEMHLRYGRDFVVNYNKYCDFAQAVVRDRHSRCLDEQLKYRAINGFTNQEELKIDKVRAKRFMEK